MRLGHAVLKVRSYRESLDFYTRLFGFRSSDTYFAGAEDNTIMAFLHCGLGERYTDHHTIALAEIPGGGFEHSAFEVIDCDDVAIGHQYLASKGYQHSWGVGRHVQGRPRHPAGAESYCPNQWTPHRAGGPRERPLSAEN
jgi:catechol 2,3-dioxygenase-like lactoylglutathione lyase family enzyme